MGSSSPGLTQMVTMGHKAKILNPSKGQVGRSGGLTEMRARRVRRVRRVHHHKKKRAKDNALYRDKHAQTHKQAYMHTHIQPSMYTHTHTGKHSHTQSSMHACIHTQASMHTHRQTYTHIGKHEHTRPSGLWIKETELSFSLHGEPSCWYELNLFLADEKVWGVQVLSAQNPHKGDGENQSYKISAL